MDPSLTTGHVDLAILDEYLEGQELAHRHLAIAAAGSKLPLPTMPGTYRHQNIF
jgi:hypothetical protein